MKTNIDLVDDVFQLVNVPPVSTAASIFLDQLPDGFSGEAIVINSLPVTGEQLQKAIVNINIHTPNLVLSIDGVPDNSQPNRKRLKEIAALVLPLVKDGLVNDMVTAVETVNLIRDEEVKQHFLNIRVAINSINL